MQAVRFQPLRSRQVYERQQGREPHPSRHIVVLDKAKVFPPNHRVKNQVPPLLRLPVWQEQFFEFFPPVMHVKRQLLQDRFFQYLRGQYQK